MRERRKDAAEDDRGVAGEGIDERSADGAAHVTGPGDAAAVGTRHLQRRRLVETVPGRERREDRLGTGEALLEERDRTFDWVWVHVRPLRRLPYAT